MRPQDSRDRSKVYMWCKAYFNILNRLGVTHECDRKTDRHSLSKYHA